MWIDCLCIIQDGDKGLDWETEARKMGDVYQNAYCVISADHATDVEGLFFDRDPEFFSSATIQTLDDDNKTVTDWTSVDRDMWFTGVNNSPLNSRGWVFQERTLGPRVVHFCRQEIFWECREKFCCESFPETLPSSEVFNLGDAVPLRQLPVELWESSGWMGDQNFPMEDVPYEAWDDVVKAYSKTHFSYPEDNSLRPLVSPDTPRQLSRIPILPDSGASAWLLKWAGGCILIETDTPSARSRHITRHRSPGHE